jgi:putative component of membrane protein insertase Oxa1/YidC/SpoIIIJ protein YidD
MIIKQNKLLVYIFLLFSFSLYAQQADWKRWKRIEPDYRNCKIVVNKGDFQSDDFFSLLKKGYSFFISDVDGDNCPFYPTCSAFFVQAVNRTNFVQGILMFADRFTRDSNPFKSYTHYPRYINGKLYDPVDNYLLNANAVKYYSREKPVKK